MKSGLTALALGAIALALFLGGISRPPRLYYDEGFYVSSARAILAAQPDPTPEVPPLGKLMVAASIATFGDTPFGWRAMSAIFGALTLVAIFLWSQLLLGDYTLALTAALLTLFNNFLYVMSRIAMMDIFLIAFVFCGLLAFTAAFSLNSSAPALRRILLIASGIAFGLACASKWNGVDTLIVVIAVGLSILCRRPDSIECEAKSAPHFGLPFFLLALILVPIATYALTYWPLCHALHRPFNLHELIAMNAYIWHAHRNVPGNPAIAIRWYKWPLQVSPQRALSYLVGNWAIMWGGFAALLFCARRFGRSIPHTLLVALYAANLLQWAVTPQRNLYYYYYFAAAMFLGVAVAAALRDLPPRICGIRLSILAVVIAACMFLYCLPRMAHLDPPFECIFGCWS